MEFSTIAAFAPPGCFLETSQNPSLPVCFSRIYLRKWLWRFINFFTYLLTSYRLCQSAERKFNHTTLHIDHIHLDFCCSLQWYVPKAWSAKTKRVRVTRTWPFKWASPKNVPRLFLKSSIPSGTRNSSCKLSTRFVFVLISRKSIYHNTTKTSVTCIFNIINALLTPYASAACSNVRLWKLDTQKESRNTSWRLSAKGLRKILWVSWTT